MSTRLSIDRIEKGKMPIAVLLTDDGFAINVPKSILPRGAKPGDIFNVTFDRDEAATKQVSDDTKNVQNDLKATDPGGDLKL